MARLPLVLCLVLLAGPRLAAADNSAPDAALLQKRSDAAARAYAAAERKYKSGTGDLESAYRWSVRWYETQRDQGAKRAAQDHLARMKTLEAQARQAAATGMASADDVAAAEYFRLEAEAWAARR